MYKGPEPHRKETRHARTSESGPGSGPTQAARSGPRRHPAAAYSTRTEQAYVDWIRRFILFHGKRHPADMGAPKAEAFLTHLAVQGKVAASTQNQALNAIVFLYRQVLKKDFGWLEGVQKPVRLPVVFTREEARAVLARLDGIRWMMASLLYGSGLRLMECARLRVRKAAHDAGAGGSSCGGGEANYCDIVIQGATNKDAAWYYPQPKEAAKQNKGYTAFWRGVTVGQ